MRLIPINHDNCLAAVKAVKAKFQSSKASAKLKKISRSIKPIVFIFGRRGKILASAYGLSLRSFDPSRKRYGLRESIHPCSQIGKRRYFMIIEVNPNAFSKRKVTTWKYLCRVMGHEMGHLLDDIVREQGGGPITDADPATDHDEFWATLSKYYGGNDSPIVT
jgi:hypothetical protein